MRKILIAVAGLLAVSPALANSSAPIERIVNYYDDASFRNQVGQTTYYCDNTDVTTGFVSSETQEIYYGCP
jgi:hypothetical protein